MDRNEKADERMGFAAGESLGRWQRCGASRTRSGSIGIGPPSTRCCCTAHPAAASRSSWPGSWIASCGPPPIASSPASPHAIWAPGRPPAKPTLPPTWPSAQQADLVAVEDLHQLPARGAEALVHLLDQGRARRHHVVLTSGIGPAELTELPGRLTSRLAAGLVVRLEPLGPASRRTFLTEAARVRGLAL